MCTGNTLWEDLKISSLTELLTLCNYFMEISQLMLVAYRKEHFIEQTSWVWKAT